MKYYFYILALSIFLSGCSKPANNNVHLVNENERVAYKIEGDEEETLYLFKIKGHMYLWDTNGGIEHFAGCPCDCMSCILPAKVEEHIDEGKYSEYSRKQLVELIMFLEENFYNEGSLRDATKARSPDGT
jgi:hypothetical protein